MRLRKFSLTLSRQMPLRAEREARLNLRHLTPACSETAKAFISDLQLSQPLLWEDRQDDFEDFADRIETAADVLSDDGMTLLKQTSRSTGLTKPLASINDLRTTRQDLRRSGRAG